jgi:hypothetical protein
MLAEFAIVLCLSHPAELGPQTAPAKPTPDATATKSGDPASSSAKPPEGSQDHAIGNLPVAGLDVIAPRRTEAQAWSGTTLLEWPVSNPNTVQSVLGRKQHSHSLVSGLKSVVFHDGTAYGIRKIDGPRLEFLSSEDWRSWETLGTFQMPGPNKDGNTPAAADPQTYVQLSNGRILALAKFDPFIQEGSGSHLAILAIGEDQKVKVRELVLPSFEVWDRAKLKARGGIEGFGWMLSGKPLVLDDFMNAPALESVGSWIVLVLPRSGYILVLDPENGRIRREAVLFPSVLDKDQAAKPKEASILAWRPTREGELLLVTRSEDAVLNSRSIFLAERAKDKGVVANKKLLEAAYLKSFEAFPELLWWKFDPQEGRFTRVPTPEGMPDKIHEFSTYSNFGFVMDPTGHPQPRVRAN